jgi:hypothetical protein
MNFQPANFLFFFSPCYFFPREKIKEKQKKEKRNWSSSIQTKRVGCVFSLIKQAQQ